jgi:NAD(P)-dependent dehydrogenase (short-subunit alcohol dehydrogenase family)
MEPTRISLEGKVAIITGASRGIGEAIARTFAAHGAQVVLAARKPEALQAVADSIGPAARAVPAHTGKEADCKRLVAAALEAFGRADILINNAATNPYFGPMLGVEEAAWDKTFEVNLKGYFWMAREVANHLVARNAPGSIINIASVAGLEAAPLQGVYGMTKAAVISMTKTLAYELAGARVRVNALAPGLVETRLAGAIVQDEALLAEWTRKTPLGRHGQPGEIAGAALYLASDAASYMTGQTLAIDGGMTIC